MIPEPYPASLLIYGMSFSSGFCSIRLIRVSASDQFFYIVTKANNNTTLLVSFISLLFSAVEVCTYIVVHSIHISALPVQSKTCK